VDTEQRLALSGIADRRDDELVEQPRGGLEDLEVAVRGRVERPRTEGGPHEGFRRWHMRVTTVVPYRFTLTTSQLSGGSIGRSLSATTTPASRAARRGFQSANA